MKTNAPETNNPLLLPLANFLRLEAAGGLILMASAVVALIAANSALAVYYDTLLSTPLTISLGTFGISKPLLLWVNDGLMAVFFFLVGMELKREVLEGHLSSLRQAALPAFAAAGGMLVPAAIYAALNWTDAAAMRGWAIPTATDIAFALGVLSLLGNRVPAALKALLLSVAIFDDLGAIVVIALFYTAELSALSLGVAAVLALALVVLNRAGVMRPAAYILIGIPLWVAVLKSGVHATLAGVFVAMCIPLRVPDRLASRGLKSPLRDLEGTLHPWVAFGILPVFAFANAGVSLTGLAPGDTLHPVPLGIVAGLFLGKQIGVLGLSWLAIRARVATLPDGVGWWHLYGTSLLCGIGFTMSLFIASLAFEQGSTAYLGLDRLGILIGSLVSGLLGYMVLRFTTSNDPTAIGAR
ncbi:MAG: Na+/H+ antiporter NhaA [Gammaproteobacteria bacterium]